MVTAAAVKKAKKISVSSADAKKMLVASAGLAGQKLTPEQVEGFPDHLQRQIGSWVTRSCDRYLHPRPARN